MPELEQAALDAAEERGQYLLPRELLTYVERYDDAVEGGVPLERLEAYAEALNERGVESVDADQIDALVAEDRTDAETWEGPDAIYEVGDGLSAFPAEWHERLRGEDDVKEFVDVLSGDIATEDKDTATGGMGGGVPQQLLIDAGSALGPLSRDGVKEAVERLREEGVVEERADQHPNARIWPAHE